MGEIGLRESVPGVGRVVPVYNMQPVVRPQNTVEEHRQLHTAVGVFPHPGAGKQHISLTVPQAAADGVVTARINVETQCCYALLATVLLVVGNALLSGGEHIVTGLGKVQKQILRRS